MNGNGSNPLKTLNIKLRQGYIRAQDKLGAFFEAVSLTAIAILGLSIMALFKIGGASDWASLLSGFAGTAIMIFFQRRAERQHSILIEVTMSYLIHGGKSYLDELLGKFISGRWRREQLKPGDALFDVLEEICRHGQDYEMKRRIAAALPYLGEVDSKRTLKIVGILRGDSDPRWKSDLRRRAIEALIIAPSGGIALIHQVKSNQVKDLLQLRENDEVYTAFAIVEALQEWEETQKELVADLKRDLLEFGQKIYSNEENQAIASLFDLLTSVAETGDIFTVADQFDSFIQSQNEFMRIAAARNILLLSKRLTDRTLDFILRLLDSSQPKNVRRPMARQQVIEFLIKTLDNTTHRDKAESLLLKLIGDQDQIIRVTAFDKAESLKERNGTLLSKICDSILANTAETSQVLRERAQRIKEGLPK